MKLILLQLKLQPAGVEVGWQDRYSNHFYSALSEIEVGGRMAISMISTVWPQLQLAGGRGRMVEWLFQFISTLLRLVSPPHHPLLPPPPSSGLSKSRRQRQLHRNRNRWSSIQGRQGRISILPHYISTIQPVLSGLVKLVVQKSWTHYCIIPL